MTARLLIDADPAPELIERICRLLRHRGATVTELTVRPADPATTRLDALVRLDGAAREADVETLVRQLRRLSDVRSVAVAD